MAKGMSMEEFRQALSSDAREENEKLKKKLEELKTNSSKEIQELKEELEEYKHWCEVLCNRCYALTHGTVCIYCNLEYCKHYKYMQEELDAAADYMTKKKMPRNSETLREINKFIDNRRKMKDQIKKEKQQNK